MPEEQAYAKAASFVIRGEITGVGKGVSLALQNIKIIYLYI
jgi:hypothetical protein